MLLGNNRKENRKSAFSRLFSFLYSNLVRNPKEKKKAMQQVDLLSYPGLHAGYKYCRQHSSGDWLGPYSTLKSQLFSCVTEKGLFLTSNMLNTGLTN